MAVINLNEVYKDAFGTNPPKKIAMETAADRLEHSNLGQPYYDTDIFGREFFMPIRLDEQLVSFAVVGCTWKKTIISTGMPERGGTVKELISIDDYLINIKGILINPDNEFVEAGMVQIFNTFKKNQSVTLRSVITDIFLSGKSNDKEDTASVKKEGDPYGYKVVIKEIKWPAISGVEHAKPFEIDLESDLVFNLQIQ